MRSLKITDEAILKRINEDKEHFQEVIGGEGEWSEEDVLREWIKVLDTVKN